MSKRVSSKIWKLVNNITPGGASKNISWEDAWINLATWGKFEGSVETKVNGDTLFDIWIGDIKMSTITIKNGWGGGDWNWDEVYGQALHYIFDNRLVKKPRAKRSDAGISRF